MAALAGHSVGERVAELRRRRGFSQKDLAMEVGRSESWVSQVERDILPVERVSVLRALADALGAAVSDLRPEEQLSPLAAKAAPEPLATLRLVMTGHPALPSLLGATTGSAIDVNSLKDRLAEAWRLTHASEFVALAKVLAPLLTDLEISVRGTTGQRRTQVSRLLTSAYQAASAAFARQDEAAASWLAADRAIMWAERAGDPLGAVAGGFRMGHAFVTLRRLDQAEHVATQTIDALETVVASRDCSLETLSLYGAMYLLLAVVAAREGDRSATRQAMGSARKIAGRLGEDRNDYNTEFGPTNVELHAVATAIDLGDAGEAIERAASIDAAGLSRERRSRLAVDIARAHVQRRHIGDAVAALLAAEEAAPEQVQTLTVAREAVQDLLDLSGRRTPQDLLDLARRTGVLI